MNAEDDLDEVRRLLPEGLADNLDHLANINRTLEKLKRAQRDTRAAILASAERACPSTPEVAAASYDYTLEVVGLWHLKVLRAMGWGTVDAVQCALRRHGTTGPPPFERGTTLPGPGMPCVYALLIGQVVVYVGRTTNVRNRLKAHYTGGKRYDSAEWWICDDEDVARDLEAILQRQHRPSWNLRTETRTGAAA